MALVFINYKPYLQTDTETSVLRIVLSNQDQHHLQPSSSIVLRCVVLCTYKSFPTHSELCLVSLLHLLRSLTHVSWSVTILCRESVTLSGRWIPQRFIARKPNQRSSSSKLCYSYDNSVILNKIAVNPWAAGTSPAKAQVKTISTSLHTLPLFILIWSIFRLLLTKETQKPRF